ncbi:hypothetical protein [Nostoc sp. UHCC 0870]|uniref:hypothetical protein n=1 Tax=Nostoc sp. UHCC 0870 TaxID=2914041 RepID=UPI001EDD9C5A|nr:hypothetical protein [Nostoc sp. UHCC 0870]UKO97999.1 hypothetical protein L6494_26195 [Nostoc sp. UHCC 0870]
MTRSLNSNVQVNVSSQIDQNPDFKSVYEYIKRLLNSDDTDLNGLEVGEMRPYLFRKPREAIVYSLTDKRWEKGVIYYTIEIQQYLPTDTLKALMNREVLEAFRNEDVLVNLEQNRNCVTATKRGVYRADKILLWVEIVVTAIVLLIFLSSKLIPQNVSIRDSRPVPEQKSLEPPNDERIKP